MKRIEGGGEHVVVVGAGLAGLATVMHLAGRGRTVTMLERDAGPGGRTGRLDDAGYRLDTGPTVLTMPGIMRDTFAAVGAELADHLRLVPLDPAYTAHFADGSRLSVHADGDRMTEAVRAFAGPREADGYRRLRAWLTRLYEVEFGRFVAANVDSPFGLVSADLARLVALGGFRRLTPAIASFLHDERLQRVFSFQALYAGESPMRALALYAVISYMDTVGGVVFPEGGVAELPRAMAAAASVAGVRIRYGEPVNSLERKGSRVIAVHTGHGERIPCDALVLATEPAVSYRLLGRWPKRPVRLRPAPSAVVLHAGLPSSEADLGHHTISFGQAWHTTFEELIKTGKLMSDPSLLITRPTATDASLAPAGKQLYSVLAPVPNLERAPRDWAGFAENYAHELAEVVRTRLLPGFAPEMSQVLSPADWAAQGMVAGTPFSYAHSFLQTGPFRPRNLPRGTSNVVLAGGGTVPGVGVPTVLLSGRLAADRVTGSQPHLRRSIIELTAKGTR